MSYSYACSCFTIDGFCAHAEEISKVSNGLVWIGEFIETQPSSGFATTASKFRIKEIIAGDVILPENPIADGSEFKNSLQEVWVFGGSGAACMRFIKDQDAVFACQYSEGLGYTPTICAHDYLPIDNQGKIDGFIHNTDHNLKISVDKLKRELADCLTAYQPCFSDQKVVFSIIQNPIEDVLTFSVNEKFVDYGKVSIHDISGRLIRQYKSIATLNQIPVKELPNGIYLFSFEYNACRYRTKIIKQ